MGWVEVRNVDDELVWKSPEIEQLGVDQVANTVKVFDFELSQVVAGYVLKPGERVVKMDADVQEPEAL